MRIGLIDVDGHSGHPNLALMRISAFHKSIGDSVEWYSPMIHTAADPMDRVYMSKVFTFEPDYQYNIFANEIVKGGTGYKDYSSLPAEIEAMAPDYTIYPNYKAAIGFLTRGCIRNCPWCIVPRKEGTIRPASTWQEIKRPDRKNIVFLDNNVLAHEHGLAQIEDMAGQPVWVDFNQGLDARLITPEIGKMLGRLRWTRFVRLACDTPAMLPIIEQAKNYLVEGGVSKSRLWAYALVQDVEEAEKRVLSLELMGITPFAQPYRDFNGASPPQIQRDFARWVNNRATFKSCTWEEYMRAKGYR